MLGKYHLILLMVDLHICYGAGPLARYSTKTHYNLSKDIDKNDKFLDLIKKESAEPKECKTKKGLHMYGNFRHGSRYPGAKDTKTGRELITKLQNVLPPDKLAVLNAIIQDYENHKPQELTPSGKLEHKYIGRGYGQIFKDIGLVATAPGDLFYGSTSKERSITSMLGFMEGFKEVTQSVYDGAPPELDKLLRFFEFCPNYLEKSKNNKALNDIETKFLETKNPELLADLKAKLGAKAADLKLSGKEMSIWNTIAGIELAMNYTSNFGDYLSDSFLEIMEFASDLKTYWTKGPGLPINYEMSCEVIKEIFGIYEQIIAGKVKEKGRFYFSHAETLIPLLAIIGLFKTDVPFMDTDFEKTKNRAFKTTRVSPFATNFVFTLMECKKTAKTDPNKIDPNNVYIQLYFKGSPYKFPFCEASICPYNTVRKELAKYIDECDFTKMCTAAAGAGVGRSEKTTMGGPLNNLGFSPLIFYRYNVYDGIAINFKPVLILGFSLLILLLL